MKRKYTEKWGNMGGLKKTPFFLRILASAPSETVRSNPARPVKKFDEVRFV